MDQDKAKESLKKVNDILIKVSSVEQIVEESKEQRNSSNSSNKMSIQGQSSKRQALGNLSFEKDNSSSLDYSNLGIEKMNEEQLVKVIKKAEKSIAKKM